jgi:drug/metabolite transporter (DMT)-like permease
MAFNWIKEGQALLGERLATLSGDPGWPEMAPAIFVTVRFLAAIVLWASLFPSSVRGWSSVTVKGGLAGGVLLSTGMLLQHYGLAYTSESLSAFLTSLTVLFTPMIAAVVFRQRVGVVLWVSVAFATAGVMLMTLYRAEGRFDRGVLLGLLCAVVFSADILVVEHYGRRENALRFTLAQLIVAATVFAGFSWVGSRGRDLPVAVLGEALWDARLLVLLGSTLVFSTLITFGLMFRFQPQTTATRAALTYMTEPLFATAYAWVVAGRAIGQMALIGGGLIILGNVIAELWGRHGGRDVDVARPQDSTSE